MSQEIINILATKYRNETLAHLYLVEPNTTISSESLTEWMGTTIANMLDINLSKLKNSPDILILNPSEKKSYTVDDCTEIFKFLNFKAQELNRKFLIIPEAQKLSITVANKLLKTFEEPPIAATIFLLNQDKTPLLETISSRSIKLRINTNNSALQNTIESNLQNIKNFEDFDKFCTENYKTLKELTNDFTSFYLKTKESNYAQLLDVLKTLEEDFTYNNASNHIKLKVFHLLSKINS